MSKREEQKRERQRRRAASRAQGERRGETQKPIGRNREERRAVLRVGLNSIWEECGELRVSNTALRALGGGGERTDLYELAERLLQLVGLHALGDESWTTKEQRRMTRECRRSGEGAISSSYLVDDVFFGIKTIWENGAPVSTTVGLPGDIKLAENDGLRLCNGYRLLNTLHDLLEDDEDAE